jgi:hypothetical protein
MLFSKMVPYRQHDYYTTYHQNNYTSISSLVLYMSIIQGQFHSGLQFPHSLCKQFLLANMLEMETFFVGLFHRKFSDMSLILHFHFSEVVHSTADIQRLTISQPKAVGSIA